MPRLALLLFPVLMAFSLGASAGTVTVQYQLTGGEIDFSFQFVGGPITGGAMTARFQASGVNTIETGPATLLSFDAIAGTINRVQVAGLPSSRGFATARPSVGYATFDGLPTILSGPSLSLSVAVHLLPGIAAVDVGFYRAFETGGLSGFGYFTGPRGRFTEYYVSVDFTFQEVSRTFVPEPGRGLVSVAAIAAGLGLFLLRRRAYSERR